MRSLFAASTLILSVMAVKAAPDTKPAQGKDWLSRFNSWCCQKIGFGCGRIAVLRPNRSADEPRPKGGSLMVMDLESKRLDTLWKDCKCWSPVPLTSGDLAVATALGIYLVPREVDQPKRLIFKATDILELLGIGMTNDDSLLFLRSSSSAKCIFEPWTFTVDTMAAAPATQIQELTCGDVFPFPNLVKPSQVRGDRELITEEFNGKYEIDVRAESSIEPLIRTVSDDVLDRFDPIWLGESRVAFVASR